MICIINGINRDETLCERDFMNTTTEKTAGSKNLSSNSPPLIIKRTIHAPVERIWKAWSDSVLFEQWSSPRGYSIPSAVIDFRVGGKYLFAMQDPEGKKLTWGAGVYKEISPFSKIVYADHFSDDKGNIISPKEAGIENWEGSGRAMITVEFENNGFEDTTITLTHEGIPKSAQDDCEAGWGECLDKLRILEERS